MAMNFMPSTFTKRPHRSIAFGLLAVSIFALASCAPATSPQPVTSNEEQTHEGDDAPPPQSAADQKALEGFQEPTLTEQEQSTVLAAYGYLDPSHVVPDNLLSKAVVYFNANKSHISNQDYLSVVDFSQSSSKARFFIINMRTGAVQSVHVAHGKNSDPNNDGIATVFSNKNNSEMSSVGYYHTAETYSGAHGLSLRLDGLSSTNSNARSRAIVLHGADYVYDSNSKAGRSWGCLAVSMANRTSIVNALKNGSIIYASVSK
jgi:hypothetical protein